MEGERRKDKLIVFHMYPKDRGVNLQLKYVALYPWLTSEPRPFGAQAGDLTSNQWATLARAWMSCFKRDTDKTSVH